MSWVDWITSILPVLYGFISICYLINGEYAKSVYFFGATVLVIGVLMK